MLLDSSHSAVCLPVVAVVCIMYMDGWQWCLENVSHARWWRWLHIRASTILSRLNLRDQNILNTFVPKQASFYEGVFSTWPTYHKHCTQPSDTEICCDCEYERPWVDRAQGTGCSTLEEPREGGVLWSHDKILSLLFIYSSSGSHRSQGPITLWITVDLSPCGHMVCSSHRAEYIWKNTHIMYCGIFPSRRSELNFLLSRVRVEVLALLLSVE